MSSDVRTQTLNISELFYSLQGEGGRAGTPTIFIRLQGCKTKHACFTSGVLCDTEFESGKAYTIAELETELWRFAARDITWTGGEPLDQLSEEIVAYFNQLGYHQSLETSGLRPRVNGFDYITVSPKVAEHIVEKNFPNGVNELRYVRHKGQQIPAPSIAAERYYISPHSNGFEIDLENLQHCIELCKQNPSWSLSVQQHKLWKVL